MSDDELPSKESLIEFPSEISIKAMGLADDTFQTLVATLVDAHLHDDENMEVTAVPSSKGKYISVRVKFIAQSQAQLEAIYADLHAHQRVLFTM